MGVGVLIKDHLRKRGHEAVVPSQRMLRLWHTRIGKLFATELLPCEITFGPTEVPDAVGLCYPLEGGQVRIHLDHSLTTRHALLSTLAHEMVHQWQHQADRPLTHGPGFRRWQAILARHGLNI